MNLFEHIKHDILGCGESGIKVDAQILIQGPFFGQTVKKNLHTRKTNGAVCIDVCTNAAHALIFQ